MPPVNLVAPDGRVRVVEEGSTEHQFALDSGWRPETGAEAAKVAGQAFAREGTEGVAGTILAGVAAGARGLTGGLSDAALGALGGSEYFAELAEAHPTVSLGGEVLGALSPGGVGGLATRAGERVAGRIAGEGAAATIARTATRGGVEGGIQGLGTGVSELALSSDPLSAERIASVLSSNVLLGGGVGGGLHVGAKGLDVALSKTSKKLREFADATPQIVPAPAPEFPGAPKFDELPPAPPPPKRKRPAGAPEPKPRGPYEEREMLVGDLDDVRMARFRELRDAKKLGGVDGVQLRVEEASNLRRNPPGIRKKLPASHALNKPIDVVMDAEGKMRLVDGYVRLASMPRDAKIKVRIRRGDASAGAAPPVTADNFADLDAKALREARQAELAAIQAARAADRAPLADDIAALRKDLKDQKLFLATKDKDVKGFQGVKEAAKISLDADKQLDKILLSPKDLAENPRSALRALRVQETAIQKVLGHDAELRAVFAGDKTGTRLAALDAFAPALRRNRELQERIVALAADPASTRLSAIDEAAARLADRVTPEPGLGAAGALGLAATFAAPLPVVGGAVVAASSLVGRVAQKTRKALGAVANRTSRAIDKVLDVGRKAAPISRAAPVLATKVLARVSFAPQTERERGKGATEPTLAELYKKRSAEIRSQTAYGPTGAPVIRPAARWSISEQLASIGMIDPLLADRLETLAARRLEFLASKLPRRPDLDGAAIAAGGDDLWQPSDMEMRTFARYVAAAEDPGAVEERIADGSITPEDAEAYRAVYPERMAAITAEIMSRLPTLQAQLPYQRRLALTIFTGVPVDPAMDPRVLRILQGGFAAEEGTAGGTQAPRPMPAFGSVTKPQGTPAQERAG